jgi:DNA modification methylase
MNKEIINNIELYNADCFDVMPMIADKSIDCIIADLPYGTTACKWDSVLPFDKLWEQYKRIIKDNGAIVLFGSEPFSSHLRMSNIKMYKYDWIWNKVNGANFMNIKNRPFKTHENIIIFSNGNNFTFNPIRVSRSKKSLKRHPSNKEHIVKRLNMNTEHYNLKNNNISCTLLYDDGKKHPIDLIEFQIAEKQRYTIKHPTKKPVALLEYLIKTYTNENELILDNTMGSGTTGVACQNTNRKFIGIEKETNYFDIAVKRIKDNNNLFT